MWTWTGGERGVDMDRRGEGCEHGQEGRGVWRGVWSVSEKEGRIGQIKT